MQTIQQDARHGGGARRGRIDRRRLVPTEQSPGVGVRLGAMTSDATPAPDSDSVTGHGGTHTVAAAAAHGQSVMWTLSGAHVFPVYDAAVGGRETVDQSQGDTMRAQREGPMRLIDVRHEATAAFAAEATGKLTRSPGFAVVTAGPGVTNTVSAITGAWFNGSPMVVLGGRSPAGRWGQGALQELDHPPLVESVTKAAFTVHDPHQAGPELERAFRTAGSPHRGPVFVDIPMDVLFSYGQAPPPTGDGEPSAPADPCLLYTSTSRRQQGSWSRS